ncbi:hypothetical protein PR048_008167 [Dryococelus australis]|uniref:Uncharacterized protein n=1 Tax=Dryococelus australis TaxID=614101 RepID=A0ABQ9HWB7_9NEOP|nr:hypothetical protein PR048_008167 [Dryococelus australis]
MQDLSLAMPHEHIWKITKYGHRKKLNFLPVFEKDIDVFDPSKKQSEEWVKVQNLAKAFPNVIANNEYDELNSEFVAYTLWDPSPELSIAMTHDPDTYWHNVSVCGIGGKPCFPVLCKLAKAMLILPYSNIGWKGYLATSTLLRWDTDHASLLFVDPLIVVGLRQLHMQTQFPYAPDVIRFLKLLDRVWFDRVQTGSLSALGVQWSDHGVHQGMDPLSQAMSYVPPSVRDQDAGMPLSIQMVVARCTNTQIHPPHM